MMKELEKLAPFEMSEPPFLPGFNGKRSAQGEWHGVNFLWTEDHDGQIEMSISKSGAPSLPSPYLRAQFISFIGVKPVETTQHVTTFHMVLKVGTRN